MVKVIYGISGTGNGHMTRAWTVIEYLKRRHNITTVTEKNAYQFLSKKIKNTVEITDLDLKYKKNKVAAFGTFWLNLKNLKKIIKSIKKVNDLIKKQKPDILINDFAVIPNLLCLWHKIPIITVDNNQLVLKAKLKLPKKWWWAKLKAVLAIRFMVLTASYRFITSFFFPELKSKNAAIVPPILRKEVRKLKPSEKNQVLVYQTSSTNTELLKVLKKIKQKFIVYGFDKEDKTENLTLKKFSETEFLKDLASAKAVIMNGGFSLMTECIHLNKPILSIPIKGQIEQMINALYIKKLGLGMCIAENNEEKIREFLSNLTKYKKNLKECIFNHDEIFQKLEQKIKELT